MSDMNEIVWPTPEEVLAKKAADHERLKELLLKRVETDPDLAELLTLMYNALHSHGHGFP